MRIGRRANVLQWRSKVPECQDVDQDPKACGRNTLRLTLFPAYHNLSMGCRKTDC